jgi:hypothetical protein
VPVTVAIEILSPANSHSLMISKEDFYEEHGVEEYYVYDPESNRLVIRIRQGSTFRRVRPAHDFVSPRLGIRFDLSGEELVIYGPDGKPFQSFEMLKATERQAQQRADQAEQRADQAEQRGARMAELTRKALSGTASPEEVRELEALLAQSTHGS